VTHKQRRDAIGGKAKRRRHTRDRREKRRAASGWVRFPYPVAQSATIAALTWLDDQLGTTDVEWLDETDGTTWVRRAR